MEVHNSPSVGGLSLELHRRLSQHYGRLEAFEKALENREKKPELWKFESHVLEDLIMKWLNEYPLLSIIKSSLSDSGPLKKVGNVLTALHLANGTIVQAKVDIVYDMIP